MQLKQTAYLADRVTFRNDVRNRDVSLRDQTELNNLLVSTHNGEHLFHYICS